MDDNLHAARFGARFVRHSTNGAMPAGGQPQKLLLEALEPRVLLNADTLVVQLVQLPDQAQGQDIVIRMAEEAVGTGASQVISNCPFCIQMFEDGVPAVHPEEEGRMRPFDVAELLEASVFGPKA